MLKNPFHMHRAVALDYDQWHYAFTNTFPEDESKATYERYAIPASGTIFWASVLANLQPGQQDTWVDYRNDDRAPLLFLSGGRTISCRPPCNDRTPKHYTSDTITEVKEYEGKAHLMPAQEGWEEIADYALEWAEEHARRRPRADRRWSLLVRHPQRRQQVTASTSLVTGTDFITVSTKDIDAAVDFYGKVLGLPEEALGRMPAVEFETGNLTVAVMQSDAFGLEFRANTHPIEFRVDDFDAARAELESRGIEFKGETLDSGVCFQAFFDDPDGNALAIHHYAPPA